MTPPRLNNVIGALESGRHAFASFAAPDPASAVEFSTTDYDGLVFETEHKPWDVTALRDSLQYLLNRRQIHAADSLAPAVTPLVRIPANGGEKAQWHAKQVLDLGAYGVVWPHITTVDEARNAVAACRYPSLSGSPRHEPAAPCAATARARRHATGASPTPSTTREVTSGRSTRTARSSSPS